MTQGQEPFGIGLWLDAEQAAEVRAFRDRHFPTEFDSEELGIQDYRRRMRQRPGHSDWQVQAKTTAELRRVREYLVRARKVFLATDHLKGDFINPNEEV